ncbi:protein lin-28 homolog isoform X1 [Haliotis asinina]|uniref:protein lin-28 homolog isoform X1 n=1 Tax=Haliotis asinina TaxID=109174 RepID=UPI00353218B0
MASWLTSGDPGHQQGGGGRRRGMCKWFNVAKGWGFVTPDDGGQDVFVHQSVIKKSGFRSLGEGEIVEFDSKPSDKGMEATLVCGPGGTECRGSDRRPQSRRKFRKIRCYNCGEISNHIAAKCPCGPLTKRCYNCRSEDHLVADCPHQQQQQQQSHVFTSPSTLGRKGRNGNSNGNGYDSGDPSMGMPQIGPV